VPKADATPSWRRQGIVWFKLYTKKDRYTFAWPLPVSAFGDKADMCSALADVCYGAEADIAFYSITSSARASNAGGTVRPRALAVLRLITNSYLVGACAGRSAGFSPFRMRSTYPAAWR
jgi:hypothetical protein